MSDAILTAMITGGLSLVGVIFTNVLTAHKSQQKILSEFQKAKAETEKAQAVTDTKLQALTDEVRTHNHFAQRMPVVEEQIKILSHRLEELESSRWRAPAHSSGAQDRCSS